MIYDDCNNVSLEGTNPCTGCGICAIACPKDCIRISRNNNGFYAPEVSETSCTNCGTCREVCYKYLSKAVYDPRKAYRGKKVLSVINNYFDQLNSVTSAGVASRLASNYADKGYNVCGVVFDNSKNGCTHIQASNNDEIEALKTSKYLQSYTVDAFSSSISDERPTIVFGTPCQIYGLRKEIVRRGIEKRFILVDLFCRGVPSYLLWEAYNSYIKRHFGLRDIEQVKFRDKRAGWHRFEMRIVDSEGKTYFQSVYNDMFYYFYLNNLVMSPACYDCKFRHDVAVSDIRLGDFWGSKYQLYDEGVSLIVIMTEKGEAAWKEIAHMLRYEQCTTEDIFESQKIGAYPFPEDYYEILEKLYCGSKLEEIFIAHKMRHVSEEQPDENDNS